jgi:large subunit ribosomal protein L22
MELRAKLMNYRISCRKARLLADEIRGKNVEEALAVLDLSPKAFAKPLAKLVRSALANAEDRNNQKKAGIDVDNLKVGSIVVNQGPSMWRVRARAQGRAAWIQRKTSHVEIVLAEE